MNRTHPNLAQFFDCVLETYLIPDLIRLRYDVRPLEGKAGCTIPTAMLALALLEQIGFLIRPTEKQLNLGDTDSNIEHVLSKSGLFPDQYSKLTQELIFLFRHSLMHQGFQNTWGISKAGGELPLVFCIGDNPIPNLNVDVLVDDLLKALSALKVKVNSDSNLADQMETRLCCLHQANNSKRKKKTKKKNDCVDFTASKWTATTTTQP